MAGGTFDINQGKIRPGSYINYKSRKKKNDFDFDQRKGCNSIGGI